MTIESEIETALTDQAPATIDPAPQPIDVHREQFDAMVRQASAAAREGGRITRELHDVAMASMAEEGEALLAHHDDYFGKLAAIMRMQQIMQDALKQQIDVLKGSFTLPEAPTLRRRPNGKAKAPDNH